MTVATAPKKSVSAPKTVHRPSLWDLPISAGKKTRLYRMLYQFGPANGTLLLLPWLVGLALVVQLPRRPYLLLPAIGYAAGMWQGRRKAGL